MTHYCIVCTMYSGVLQWGTEMVELGRWRNCKILVAKLQDFTVPHVYRHNFFSFGSLELIFKSEFDRMFFSWKIIFCGLIMGAGFQEPSSCRHRLSAPRAKSAPKRISKIEKSIFENFGVGVSKNRYCRFEIIM